MRHAFEILLQIQNEGLIGRFAVGGAIAAGFYVEAVATEDLDVFAFLQARESGLVLVTPIYERLKQLGGIVQSEHVRIGKWPVQVLPAYNPLIESAVLDAKLVKFEVLEVPVVSPEHLCAIALQTGRAKDFQRVNSLLEAGVINEGRLQGLVVDHELKDRWSEYVRRFG